MQQRQLTDAAGNMVFTGAAGHTYEFLALATDVAGQPGEAGGRSAGG